MIALLLLISCPGSAHRGAHGRFRSPPTTLSQTAAATSTGLGVDELIMRQNRLLVDLWEKISFPPADGRETEFRLQDYGLRRQDMQGFIQHFQNCKDCAAGTVETIVKLTMTP